MAVYIKGNYIRSIYESKGYYIGLFKVSDTNCENLSDYIGRTITFTGYFHELNTFDNYIFNGKLINHQKYGEQFQVDSFERVVPEEKDSIVEFLSSGLFKGIGERKAKSIVDVLGKDTLKIILENPSNLILIPKITKKDIDILHNKLLEYESSYEIIMFLSEYGFSTRDSMIIYNTYKSKTKDVVLNNIYSLIDDIVDMNYKKIDTIALKNGYVKDDPRRVDASIIYIMREISNTFGHCYYSREEILFLLPKVLGCSISRDDIFSNLEKDLKIVIKNDRYYLKDMYDSECFIVKRIRMLNNNKEKVCKNIDDKISELESFFEIKYNDLQKEAIKKSYLRDFLIITGGPGTGKTTIMRGIVELFRIMEKISYEKLDEKIALLAPTGRASKRMSEATGMRASTIHRFLKWNKESNTFMVNEYHKSKVELIILDEASMVDTYLMASLLKGISSNCRIVLVGDDHQLPSVGAGDVLHDLIDCGMLEVVFLKELYRQGEDSNIISLAYDIRNKCISKDIFNKNSDLTFIECNDSEVLNNICEISTTYKDYNYNDFQILAPMYKGINGIDAINKVIQNIYNPKTGLLREIKIGDFSFRDNDKVIQLSNMPDDNVYNGDIGIIDRVVTGNKKEIMIDFNGNIVKYTPSSFHNFKLAYSISIHKSQGSEFDVVVIPLVKAYKKMLYQKLIYTAVTRCREKLYLVGDFEALKMAAYNDIEDTRRTTIKEYFINGID